MLFMAILLLFAILPIYSVKAHANYVRSIPSADTVVGDAPSSVQVWFSEDIAPTTSVLFVRDIHGLQADIGGTYVPSGQTKTLQVNLKPLSPGIYTVIWRTFSLVDGHDTSGSFPFTVGQITQLQDDIALIRQDERFAQAFNLPDLRVTLTNLLSLGSFILLGGSFAFYRLCITRPVLVDLQSWLDKPYRRFVTLSLIFTGIAVILASMSYLMNAGITSVAGRYGLIMSARLVLIAVLAFTVRKWRIYSMWALLPVALILLTQSLLSHSAAEAQPIIPILADWIHLTASSLWLGGVAVLALVIVPASLPDSHRYKALGLMLNRFTPIAMCCVVVIGVTGLAQSATFIGNPEALLSTSYGLAIMAKLVLLIGLIGFGAFHSQVISPRLQAWRLRDVVGARRAATRFGISILAEAILSVLIVFVIALLIALPPSRDVSPDPGANVISRSHYDVESGMKLTLGLSPGKVGLNQIDLYLVDLKNQPVEPVDKVLLRFRNEVNNAGESELVLLPHGNGHYVAISSYLSMLGQWQITALVRRSAMPDSQVVFTLDMR